MTQAKRKRGSVDRQSAADDPFSSVVKAMLRDRGVTQSRMFGSPGLKVRGKVFAMLVKGKLVVKLRRERAEALVASGDGEYFDPGHGRLMKEWVVLGMHAKNHWPSFAKEARDVVAIGK